MTAEEVTDKLEMRLLRQSKWHVQATIAISDEGLQEGVDWLSQELHTQ